MACWKNDTKTILIRYGATIRDEQALSGLQQGQVRGFWEHGTHLPDSKNYGNFLECVSEFFASQEKSCCMELDEVNVRPTLRSRNEVLQAEWTYEVFFGLQLHNIFLQWTPTSCTISQIYLIKYSTCFGHVHCPSSGVSRHCIHAIGICHSSSVGVS